MREQFPSLEREREREQERAFWLWWEKIEPYMDQYTLRMAFDAGYMAAKESE